MAKIVLGIGTSHGPQLALTPDMWHLRAQADHHNPELWYRGKTYTFPELVEERADAHFERELGPERAQARWDACQAAIARLGRTIAEAKPDVMVIFGDDQHEAFNDETMPAMAVYWGERVDDAPASPNERAQAAGIYDTAHGNPPKERTSHPVDSRLGLHLIESLVEDGFDMAHSNALPPHHHQGAIGHAFHFVYRRLMDNKMIPHVPIFLNTYYPPNQPPVKRCYELGKAVREAIESWDSDQRVVLIASGGLSHFVIEEDLDQQIIDGLLNNDQGKLTDLPNNRFHSGTSEIRNWIAVAGAMTGDGLKPQLVDYQPCYRTEAGTGCAMTFMEWR